MNRDEHIAEAGNTESASDAKKQQNQYVYWFLTWNNYDIESIEITFNILRHECDWFIMQEETGEAGNKHIQGTIKLKKRKRMTELKRINWEIHWEVTKRINASCAYCSNKDKRTGRIWTHNFTVPTQIKVSEPYGWQLEVMDIIAQPPSDRYIYWFWEPNGNMGKTTLCRYLAVKHNAVILSGKTNDILHVVSKYAEKSNLFIINIPRCSKDHINYQAIELVKDGIFMSGKYDGKPMVIDYPYIIVFANIPPNRYEMSEDRWVVKNITP